MKKVKKNLFGMGLALSMMLGMVFALMPQEVKANVGSEVLCYSASSGTKEGAWFYECGTPCVKVYDQMPYGQTLRCPKQNNNN